MPVGVVAVVAVGSAMAPAAEMGAAPSPWDGGGAVTRTVATLVALASAILGSDLNGSTCAKEDL